MQTHTAPHRRLTLREAFQTFCDRKLTGSHYRPATQDIYMRSLREFVAFCSDVAYADELSLDNVQRYDEELQRRQQRPGSKHTKIAAVTAFFAYLEEQGALSAPIAQAIAVPTQSVAKRVRPVEADEAALLLRAAREKGRVRDVALIIVLLYTGMSLSDVIDLTLADRLLTSALGPGIGSIRAKPSTSVTSIACTLRLRHRPATHGQETPLDEPTWQALNAYLAVRPNSSHPQVFLTDAGTPLTLQRVWVIVKRNARAAGMSWIQARSLRSGFILRQLAAGTPLSEIHTGAN